MIILNNPNDRASREFVASLGADHDYEIIDYYGVDRAKYTGPAPSAFPTVVVEIVGRSISVAKPADWSAVEAAIANLLGNAKQWAIEQVNQRANDLNSALTSPHAAQAAVYLDKERQAVTLQAVIDAGDDPDPADYPAIEEGRSVSGLTLAEETAAVLAKAAAWRISAARIDAVRRTANLAINQAQTVEAVTDVLDNLAWPNVGSATDEQQAGS